MCKEPLHNMVGLYIFFLNNIRYFINLLEYNILINNKQMIFYIRLLKTKIKYSSKFDQLKGGQVGKLYKLYNSCQAFRCNGRIILFEFND